MEAIDAKGNVLKVGEYVKPLKNEYPHLHRSCEYRIAKIEFLSLQRPEMATLTTLSDERDFIQTEAEHFIKFEFS